MNSSIEGRPVVGNRDPYAESDVGYLVVEASTMTPDIVEVDKGTPGAFPTLQKAKTHAMGLVRERMAEGSESLDRLRAIGVEMPRHM